MIRHYILSGDWNLGKFGETHPHLHINWYKIPSEGQDNSLIWIFNERERIFKSDYSGTHATVDDLYRDILDPNSVSSWTVDNDPQFPF